MTSVQQALEREKSAYARVDAPCRYFGSCGGCALQDVAYADQLALKRRRIEEALAPLGARPELEIVGLEEPWRYRNKAELTFSAEAGRLLLGYHARGSFWRVVDLEDCLLLPEPAMRALRAARTAAEAAGYPAYHPKSHQGVWRYLIVRASQASGQVLLCFLTSSGAEDTVMRGISAQLLARHPELRSIYWGITDKLADIAVPERLVHLGGAEYLEDRLGPFHLQLHPLSFLQPSSVQADRIYALLAQELGASPEGAVWDLYCGLGLISFYLSRRARTIYAIDVEPHHLEWSVRNASLNRIANVEFRAGRVETLLLDRRFWLGEARPEAIVVDPPRAGLHPAALSSILAARPKHVAYLSCNVSSLVRDLRALVSGFPRYRLRFLRAFDMFPQTNHVETLAILDRN